MALQSTVMHLQATNKDPELALCAEVNLVLDSSNSRGQCLLCSYFMLCPGDKGSFFKWAQKTAVVVTVQLKTRDVKPKPAKWRAEYSREGGLQSHVMNLCVHYREWPHYIQTVIWCMINLKIFMPAALRGKKAPLSPCLYCVTSIFC